MFSERVGTCASVYAEQDSTGEPFGTLPVDFGFGSLFLLVLGVFGCVLRIVGKLARCRTIILRRIAIVGRVGRFVVVEIVKLVCEGRH